MTEPSRSIVVAQITSTKWWLLWKANQVVSNSKSTKNAPATTVIAKHIVACIIQRIFIPNNNRRQTAFDTENMCIVVDAIFFIHFYFYFIWTRICIFLCLMRDATIYWNCCCFMKQSKARNEWLKWAISITINSNDSHHRLFYCRLDTSETSILSYRLCANTEWIQKNHRRIKKMNTTEFLFKISFANRKN